MTRTIALIVVLAALAGSAAAQSDLLKQGADLLKQVPRPQPQSSAPRGSGSLSEPQAESGLREALKVATRRTVSQVGRPGGYEKDSAIHIPLPGYLETARKALGAVGAGGMLDDLELRINSAAEEAAPKAYEIFADAISRMTVNDGITIVTGPNDAATQYLKRTTTGPLTQAFHPIVQKALADAGAVKAFDSVTKRLATSSPLGGLSGIAGGRSFDLTDYAVKGALAGLFHYIGQYEADIGRTPLLERRRFSSKCSAADDRCT